MPDLVKMITLLALSLALVAGCTSEPADKRPGSCTPTPYDEIGPFYRPDAPVRNSVGKGYVLSGRVLTVNGCTPLPKSKLEFWLVNEKGEYDDAHRATVYADRKGHYRFESNRPVDYVGRLPHIHMKITAKGYQELITQHYPQQEDTQAVFDIVLEPLPQ